MELDSFENWWAVIDSHWKDILDCAMLAGAVLSRPETKMQKEDFRPFGVFLEEAKTARNHVVIKEFLDRIWHGAPDREEIHSWPSWGILCDLCSEYGYCLESSIGEEDASKS